MARFTSLLLLAAAALPFAFADSSQCADSEFFYDTKGCCLPHGGVPNPPTPPQGPNQCPTNNWYWHPGKECCVPMTPPKSTAPPQCGGSWLWNEGSSTCCEGGGSTTTTSTPAPSANPQKPPAHHKRAAAKARRSVLTCPDAMQACPISGLTGPTGDFECIDAKAELESCGGCVSTGEGQDCTAIEGVWNVGCEQGRCAVYTCAQGYKQSADGTSCIKL